MPLKADEIAPVLSTEEPGLRRSGVTQRFRGSEDRRKDCQEKKEGCQEALEEENHFDNLSPPCGDEITWLLLTAPGKPALDCNAQRSIASPPVVEPPGMLFNAVNGNDPRRSQFCALQLEDLEARGIGFETLDGVSTRGATGKLVLHILGSVAQFERQLLIERTMAGLAAARAEGRTGGNRRRMTPQQIEAARKHMAEGGLKAHQVAKMYGISERSLWRNLRWAAELEAVRGNASG